LPPYQPPKDKQPTAKDKNINKNTKDYWWAKPPAIRGENPLITPQKKGKE